MGAMREAMLREMALRGLAARTQRSYVGWMARLVAATRVPADELLESKVRTYLADLSRRGLSSSTLNQAISAVRFFFDGVLHRDWWDWELEFGPHVYKRMDDRGFNELDLRAMLEAATRYRKDVAPGRWVIEAKRGRHPWELIVEPDESLRILVVITAYAV